MHRVTNHGDAQSEVLVRAILGLFRLVVAGSVSVVRWMWWCNTSRDDQKYPHFTEYCACRKKWHSKITKYCACHANECPSHMTRHLQCAEQQISSSNITKCCACHAKWLASSILVTYETLFTMRGGTGITRQPHQILRLPRKMTLMIDLRHIWNVIYNARSNRHHPPTSPNTAPATQKCTPKSKRNSSKTVEASIPMRGRFEHDPNMNPNMNSSSRTRPFGELTFRASETHFVLKITTFRAPAIYPHFTKYCACHEKWHSKITKYCACHEKWHSDITKCCACHEKWLSDITKYCACHEKWDCHWTVTELSCYEAVTELLLSCYWTVTELNCYWIVTELWLNCDWTDLLLSCYTELLLNWAVTELSCYSTVTGTQLLLDCYWTDLLLNCYWTNLLLSCYWIVTFTALLLELLLYWTLCIFKSP